MVKIENWSLVSLPSDPYKCPTTAPMCVRGMVYGHPDKPDGLEVITSEVIAVHGVVIETRNHTYVLGTVDPSYLDWYKRTFPDREFDPTKPITT